MNTDTESILISDANIFFDLININLIDQFFAVPKKISTTDFIISEIEDEKQKKNHRDSDSKRKTHCQKIPSRRNARNTKIE